MRLDTKPGERVRFANTNGYGTERYNASQVLDTDTSYVVQEMSAGGWHSTVRLEGVIGWFNTVMFENDDVL